MKVIRIVTKDCQCIEIELDDSYIIERAALTMKWALENINATNIAFVQVCERGEGGGVIV